jgi:hypothetical protein
VSLSQALARRENAGLDIVGKKGAVFVWGSDNNGQLGLDVSRQPFEGNYRSTFESELISRSQSGRDEGVRIPIPRLQTYLKDLIIREVS